MSISHYGIWLFTRTLTNRLNQLAESHDKYAESQNRYRSGRSTTDNTYSLIACAQKYLSKKKGRMHRLSIEFSSAFDRVQHTLLCVVLCKFGLSNHRVPTERGRYSNI